MIKTSQFAHLLHIGQTISSALSSGLIHFSQKLYPQQGMRTASFISFLQYGQANKSGTFELGNKATFSLSKATLQDMSSTNKLTAKLGRERKKGYAQRESLRTD